MSTPGVRARHRAAVEADIVRVGRAHLAEVGAAALSLRAVARELGMVSSALYRYVANRDDLLTLLIVAAYDDLGDVVDLALEEVTDGSRRARFVTLAHAVRRWAREHPHDYALIYGSPVPDYDAPAERTLAAGTRVPARLVSLLTEKAPRAATGDRAALEAATEALRPVTETNPFFARPDGPPHPEALVRGLAAWEMVLGSISAEVFEHYGPGTLPEPDVRFAAVAALAADVAFGPRP